MDTDLPAPSTTGKKTETLQAESEIQKYLDMRQQRRRIFPLAALVGIIVGAVILFFRLGLNGVEALRNDLISRAHAASLWGWIFPIIFSTVGAVLAVAIALRFAPAATGSNIPHPDSVFQRLRKLDWKRLLPVDFLAGIFSIGGGMALGSEGPIVQIGGSVGAAVTSFLKATPRERFILVMAGVGAGLAAAFNAPVAGLLFVMEEMQRDFQPILFGAVFVATIVAGVVTRLGAGQYPFFIVPNYSTPPLISLPVFALLGLVAGLLGVFFNRGIIFMLNLYARLPQRLTLLAAGLTGSVIGLVSWFSPTLVGSGTSLMETILKGELLLPLILLFFASRFLLVTISYGSGTPGGILSPLLGLGAFIGLALGQIIHNLAPTIVPVPAVFAVVGMAAYFAAVARAPLTGIVLIIEMTASYAQMLPLLVACFTAYAVAEFLKELPLYETLLENDLKQGGIALAQGTPMVVDFTVEPESRFAGQMIRELELPAGCLLVRISEGMTEWVPEAGTRLEPRMRVTTIIAPEALQSLEVLREGFAAPRRKRRKQDQQK